MPRMAINGMTYHFVAQGTGPALLLLHGFTGASANWSGLMAGQPDYLVVAPDLLGHGETESPEDPARYAMDRAAADLAALLQALDATPAHVLGYSMGGRLALFFALTYPGLVRSLILESASPGLASAEERAARVASDQQLAERIEAEGIPAFVDYWTGIPLFASQKNLPEAVRASLRDQRLKNSARGLANSLRGMGTGAQPSLWERLGTLDRPALLLAGALDVKFTAIAQQMQTALPHARLTIVPNAGHTIHLEQPARFREIVAGFLSAI